jgi:hypothetical protein
VEFLNAKPLENGRFAILNSPFFVEGVAYGDHVAAIEHQDGRLVFEACTEFSGFKAISIILFDDSLKIELLDLLRGLQCVIEYGEFGKLRMMAVGVPGFIDYAPIASAFEQYERLEKLSYAELVA